MVEGLGKLKTIRHIHDMECGKDERIDKDFDIIEKELEVLSVIYNSPFIIDNLAELGKLPPEAKQRYLFGTITNKDVQKVEEFFKDVEMRNKSK